MHITKDKTGVTPQPDYIPGKQKRRRTTPFDLKVAVNVGWATIRGFKCNYWETIEVDPDELTASEMDILEEALSGTWEQDTPRMNDPGIRLPFLNEPTLEGLKESLGTVIGGRVLESLDRLMGEGALSERIDVAIDDEYKGRIDASEEATKAEELVKLALDCPDEEEHVYEEITVPHDPEVYGKQWIARVRFVGDDPSPVYDFRDGQNSGLSREQGILSIPCAVTDIIAKGRKCRVDPSRNVNDLFFIYGREGDAFLMDKITRAEAWLIWKILHKSGKTLSQSVDKR